LFSQGKNRKEISWFPNKRPRNQLPFSDTFFPVENFMLITEENGSTASLVLRQESAVSQWLSTICPLQVADEVA
jgi:hypothetical protein